MDESLERSSQPLVAKPLMGVPKGLLDQITTDRQSSTVRGDLEDVLTRFVSPAVVTRTISGLIGSLPYSSSIDIIAQVAGRAENISTDHAPIWFVNFPPALLDPEKGLLQQYMQEVLDFRSWSSLKWWADVFNVILSDNSAIIKIRQSSEFARIAFREMTKMPWLHPIKQPTNFSDTFSCPIWELHNMLISKTMSTWNSLDQDALNALEPVLKSIVYSISDSTTSYTDVRSLLSEKYEYRSETRSTRSYLRLVCFEISGAAHDVKDGKNSSHRQVECQMSYLFYEAEFGMNEWKTYSAAINKLQKSACREFVQRQTIDVLSQYQDEFKLLGQ